MSGTQAAQDTQEPKEKAVPYPAVAAIIRPYSHSPVPIWSVAGLFAATSLATHAPWPPLIYRLGFSGIFAGAGYALYTGDARNGSGISTSWSLIYLFLNGRKSLTPHRNIVSLALAGATVASSALYGSEYFLLQDTED